MPILITGHRGFIGQNMMAALPDAVGYEWGGQGQYCFGNTMYQLPTRPNRPVEELLPRLHAI